MTTQTTPTPQAPNTGAPVQRGTGAVPKVSEKDLAQRTNFMLGIPVGMKISHEKYSKEKDVSTASIVRKAIADVIGYELPAEDAKRGSDKAKLSDQEKKDRQKKANKDRRDNIKALMEAIDKGEVALS